MMPVGPRRSSRLRPHGLLAAVMAAATLAANAPSLRAAPASSPPAKAAEAGAPEALLETLHSRLATAQAAADASSTAKTPIIELYKQALESSQAAAKWRAKAAEYESLRKAAPGELKQLRAQAKASPLPASAPAANLPLPKLEDALAQAGARLETAKREAADIDAGLKRHVDRRLEVPRQIASAELQLSNLQLQPASVEPGELGEAQRLLNQARVSAAQAERDACQTEMLALDARTELLTRKRDLSSENALRMEGEVAELRRSVGEGRGAEAARQADAAQRAASTADPALRRLADENVDLAAWRAKENLAQKAAEADAARDKRQREIAQLDSDYASIKSRIETYGLTRTIGASLRNRKAELPDVRAIRSGARIRQRRISELQSGWLDLRDRRADLATLDPAIENALAASPAKSDPKRTLELQREARELLKAQRTRLDELIADHERLFGALIDLDLAEAREIGLIEEIARYIDKWILWVRSAPPPRLSDVKRIWDRASWLAAPGHWLEAAQSLSRDSVSNWSVISLPLLGLLLLWFAGLRAPAMIDRIGGRVSGGSVLPFALTLQAALFTAILAAAWTAPFALLGWRLMASEESTPFAQAMGAGALAAALLGYSFEILRQTMRPLGLAEAHFGWSPELTLWLRRKLLPFMAAAIPLTAILFAIEWQDNDQRMDPLGRILLAVTLCLAGILHYRAVGLALRGSAGAGAPIGRQRLWLLARFASGAVPAALGVASILGYYHSALLVSLCFVKSFWLTLGLLLLHAALRRWVRLASLRLALAHIRRSKEAQSPAASLGSGATAVESDAGPEIRQPEIDLSTISIHLRRMAKAVVGFALVVGLLRIWKDVLTAFGPLVEVEIGGGATVFDLLIAVLIATATIVAYRNLPGFLEAALLQRLKIDPGTGYAVTTTCRYAIALLGLVNVFRALGVDWNNVRWLAAAATVGLGFGLQEVFANFVSGLILLFERPVRVGDYVTIGAVNGQVTRIRMRATTIVDADRKELIVPNKEFITGRLVNWTLTDRIQRIVIPVAIAYGFDTQKARGELERVAHGHPAVLEDPPAVAVLTDLLGNAMNFELRVFVANAEQISQTRSDLNIAIERAFREAGIEMPTPPRQPVSPASIAKGGEPGDGRSVDAEVAPREDGSGGGEDPSRTPSEEPPPTPSPAVENPQSI